MARARDDSRTIRGLRQAREAVATYTAPLSIRIGNREYNKAQIVAAIDTFLGADKAAKDAWNAFLQAVHHKRELAVDQRDFWNDLRLGLKAKLGPQNRRLPEWGVDPEKPKGGLRIPGVGKRARPRVDATQQPMPNPEEYDDEEIDSSGQDVYGPDEDSD